MMESIRQYNDIRLELTVLREQEDLTAMAPEDFSDATDIEVFLRHSEFVNIVIPLTYSITDNIITADFFHDQQTITGMYRLCCTYRKPNATSSRYYSQRALDVVAFELVEYISSPTEPEGTEPQISTLIELTTTLRINKDGANGLSAYEIDLIYGGFVGTKEEWLQSLRQPALDAAEIADAATQATIETEQIVSHNEGLRIDAEEGRVVAESGRVEAEGLREDAEGARGTAEGIRAQAEEERNAAEGLRVAAEEARETAEGLREESKAIMDELNAHPPILVDVDGRLIWHYWDVTTNVYVSTGYAGSITNRGNYLGNATYKPLDLVSYNDSTYMCVIESTGNLPTTASFVIIAKGSYQYWLDAGNTGTLQDYIAWLNNKMNIDGSNSSIDSLTFNATDQDGNTVVLTMTWNQAQGTWDWSLPDGVIGQMFQELHIYAKCVGDVLDARVVQFAGSQGGHGLAKLAVPSEIMTLPKLVSGVSTNSGLNGDFIKITWFGYVNDVNTGTWTEGQVLYFDSSNASPGLMTVTRPVAPNPVVIIGMVAKASTGGAANGRIFVRPEFYGKLTQKDDVYAPTLTVGDTLRWTGTRFEVLNIDTAFAAKEDKTNTNLYNITTAIPLTAGSYYTSTTARAAVSTAIRKRGLELLYETASGVWYKERFIGDVANWTTAANWEIIPSKKYVDDADALKADKSYVDLQNAKQSDAIQEIENNLNAININQEPTANASDYGVVALTKNTANGGMTAKLEGLTAQNLVVNGDFRNGTTGWITNFEGAVKENGYIKLTTSGTFRYFGVNVKLEVGKKYYIKYKQQLITSPDKTFTLMASPYTTPTWAGRTTIVAKTSLTDGDIIQGSVIYNCLAEGNSLVTVRYAGNSTVNEDRFFPLEVICISDAFGAGNEPDLATCDKMFSSYFDGVKHFTATGRVRSVGKNMFDKFNYVANKTINTSGIEEASSTSNASQYISVLPSTAYILSGKATNSNVCYYTKDKVFISTATVGNGTFTTPATAYYIRFGVVYAQMDTCQLERGTVATSYISYRESALYLQSPVLRSNGTTKDEIRKGVNGYEMVQRISTVDGSVLATPVITPIAYGGLLNSNSNGTTYREKVVADAGVYGSNLAIQLTDYPISSFEKIIKRVNGVEYLLDVSTAVIASGGLSFTHPSLASGDLVLFTYYFANESTEGKTTLTYYDSRYVIADTTNGKYYKLTPSSTNGTLSWVLTEV